MRDKLLSFGNISLATKDTAAYSADTLDMNTPAVQFTARAGDVYIVFKPNAAFNAADSYQPIIQHSDDGNTFTTLATGPTIGKPGKDDYYSMPIPLAHKRYLRVGGLPTSTGTFTATTVAAWIELGR